MVELARVLPARPALRFAMVAGAALLAMAIGVAVGNPNPLVLLGLSSAVGIALLVYILKHPYRGFLVMAASAIVLVVVAATEHRYLGTYDFVLPMVLASTVLGRQRRLAIAADQREVGPDHDAIREATRKFRKVGLIYFGLAALSLVPMAFRIGGSEAFAHLLLLVRAFQGVLVFPLVLWWVRSEKRQWDVYHAVIAGLLILAAINSYQVFGLGTHRAGATWVSNHPDWPVESANETGAAMVLVWALILAKHKVRPSRWDFALLAIAFVILVLTQSRSGLAAFLVFTLFTLRDVPRRFLIGGVVVVLLGLFLAPTDFWDRMVRTLSFKKGSFEVYSFMIRVFGYESSWKIFLDNWLFGVGYIGAKYLSQNYNVLKITHLGAENFLLETATGLGVIGLSVVLVWMWRFVRLGQIVQQRAPRDSLGYQMARVNTGLFAGMFVANLTGDNLVGMVVLAQTVLWCGLMIRGGHLAVGRGIDPVIPPRLQPAGGR